MDFDLFTASPAVLLAFAAVLMVAGMAAGTLAGLLGVGGGIVIVPVLYLLLPFAGVPDEIRMHLAVGTSLATIVPTSLRSAHAHYRRGGLDVALLKALAPGVVLGVLIGTILGARAGGDTLTLIFAVVALLVSAHMGLGKADWTVATALPGPPWPQVIGVFIGGFSVVMGIGGGTFTVPILSAASVPIRRAVGTASAVGILISVPGVLGFMTAGWTMPGLPPFSLGYANLLGFCLIVPMTLLMAPVGARLAHTIPPQALRRAFALFLFLTALRMFYGVLT